MNEKIIKCIDLDEWKHSWHNKLETSEDLEKARQTIVEKICGRKDDLRLLNEGLAEIDSMLNRS